MMLFMLLRRDIAARYQEECPHNDWMRSSLLRSRRCASIKCLSSFMLMNPRSDGAKSTSFGCSVAPQPIYSSYQVSHRWDIIMRPC